MTVHYFNSEMTGMPGGLATTAGTLVAVLDHCLQAAGWTIAYSDTNRRAYRQGGAMERYVWVDDTATAATARFRVYDTMSGIDTGTVPTPSESQQSGGLYIYKSNSTAARPWAVLATETDFYLYIGHQDAVLSDNPAVYKQMFAVFEAEYGSPDATVIVGNYLISQVGGAVGSINTSIAATSGHYAVRAGESVAVGKMADSRTGGNRIASAGEPFPGPRGLMLAPIYIITPDGQTVGQMPGVFAPLHNMPAAPFDTFSGLGELAGREFMLINCSGAGSQSRVAWEISDTWGPE